jgi:single-strand DNA-binding protein
MGSVNRLLIVGNVGRDAEVRTSPEGHKVANFSVATTETWKGRDGAKQERTTWFRVALWGKQAEAIGQYLVKGKQVCVEGSVSVREYDKDNEKRFSLDVRADRVTLLGGPRADDGGASRRERSAEPEPAGPEPAGDEDIPF